MEQDAVYKAFSQLVTTMDPTPPASTVATNSSQFWLKGYSSVPVGEGLAYDMPISTLLCPAAPDLDLGQGNGTSVAYTSDSGTLVRYYMPYLSPYFGERLGRSHYMGVAGYLGAVPAAPNSDQYRGIFTNRSKVSLAEITAADGTSNVLAFGEHTGDAQKPPFIRADSWAGAGTLPTAWGLENSPPSASLGLWAWYMFSSMHTGVVNFVFADGSVRGLKTGIDWNTYIYLSGYKDGRTTPPYD
jgi:prepilin-type processing-associated H-X9-DG protein